MIEVYYLSPGNYKSKTKVGGHLLRGVNEHVPCALLNSGHLRVP